MIKQNDTIFYRKWLDLNSKNIFKIDKTLLIDNDFDELTNIYSTIGYRRVEISRVKTDTSFVGKKLAAIDMTTHQSSRLSSDWRHKLYLLADSVSPFSISVRWWWQRQSYVSSSPNALSRPWTLITKKEMSKKSNVWSLKASRIRKNPRFMNPFVFVLDFYKTCYFSDYKSFYLEKLWKIYRSIFFILYTKRTIYFWFIRYKFFGFWLTLSFIIEYRNWSINFIFIFMIISEA